MRNVLYIFWHLTSEILPIPDINYCIFILTMCLYRDYVLYTILHFVPNILNCEHLKIMYCMSKIVFIFNNITFLL